MMPLRTGQCLRIGIRKRVFLGGLRVPIRSLGTPMFGFWSSKKSGQALEPSIAQAG